jgi:hypothetical protein
VEVYDLNPDANSILTNIGSRGFVDTGDNAMIGGFVATLPHGNFTTILRGKNNTTGVAVVEVYNVD